MSVQKQAVIEISTHGFTVRGAAPWHKDGETLGFDQAAEAAVRAARERISRGGITRRNKRMRLVARVETGQTRWMAPYSTTLVDAVRDTKGVFKGTSSWKTPAVTNVTAEAGFRVLKLLEEAQK